jgi:putative multiple sugar transport system substrate-binding protein
MSKLHRSLSLLLMLSIFSGMLAGCATAAAPTTAAPVVALKSIGIVLPTLDEPRWVQDQKSFQNLAQAAGVFPDILISQGDTAKEKANVEALITKGDKVIIICPQDAKAAAAAADEAGAAGVKIISYDRLILGSKSVSFYAQFDSSSVGAAWSNYMITAAGATKGNNLYLYAGAASDNNAFLFFEGAWEAIQPKIADGTFVIKNSSEAVKVQANPKLTHDQEATIIAQITTNWDFNTAKTLAESNLTAATTADKGTVFIIAPNDGTARSISDAFLADKDVTKMYISGQDAEKASIQYIIDGKQSMTVWKDTRTLAQIAFTAAQNLLAGTAPKGDTTVNNGAVDVPATLTPVTVITKANVQVLIDAGVFKKTDFTGLP